MTALALSKHRFHVTALKAACSGLIGASISFVMMAVQLKTQTMSNNYEVGWDNLHINYNSEVSGLQPWVDQKALNTRQCIQMCWLFSACSVLTFTPDQQRCQLYQIHDKDLAFETERKTNSLVVDMTKAKKKPTGRSLYGCEKRPCSRTEMCAPVRNRITQVCISLASVFCKGHPPHILNSETHPDGVSSVVYTCAHGHFMTGTSSVSTCDRKTGVWSQVDVACSYVDCGALPPLHGAVASGANTTVSSVISYSCLAGAVSSSAQITVTCDGHSGQWSSLQGSCSVVRCGQPPAIDHTEVTLASRSTVGAFLGLDATELQTAYGGEAVYSCSTGFTKTAGFSYISKCQADGTWSPIASPLCSLVDCGEPSLVANASRIIYTATTFGENATVICFPGYSSQKDIVLTCDETEHWVGTGEACEPVNTDNELPESSTVIPLNKTMVTATTSSINNTTIDNQRDISTQPTVYQTTSLATDGNTTTFCDINNTLTNNSDNLPCPSCTPHLDAFNISNGSIEFLEGPCSPCEDRVTVRCAEDHVIVGNDTAQCVSVDGQPTWTGLENSFCGRNRWTDITSTEDGKHVFPVYHEIITRRLAACMSATYVKKTERIRMSLKKLGEKASGRVVYDPATYGKQVLLQYFVSPEISKNSATTASRVDLTLLQRDENATVCFNLDLQSKTYSVTKNGEEILSMNAKYYEDIGELFVSRHLKMHEVHIVYE